MKIKKSPPILNGYASREQDKTTLTRVLSLDPMVYDLYDQTKILNGRLRFEYRPVISEYQEKVKNPAPSFESYVKGVLSPNTVSFLKELQNRRTVFEIASICQFYFIREQYTLAVATFYRLSEEICQCFVEEKTGLNLAQSTGRESFENRFAIGLENYVPKNSKAKYGLPLLLERVGKLCLGFWLNSL